MEDKEPKGHLIILKEPKLDPVERLYVKTFLHTLSHVDAHRVVKPNIKKHYIDNEFSRKENIQYHISKGLQAKAEALTLTTDDVLSLLYKEATREGNGSNHAARIQAISLLGKHLGMFKEEKKDDTGYTFNIISYSDKTSDALIKETIQLSEEIIKDLEDIPENLFITSFNTDIDSIENKDYLNNDDDFKETP